MAVPVRLLHGTIQLQQLNVVIQALAVSVTGNQVISLRDAPLIVFSAGLYAEKIKMMNSIKMAADRPILINPRMRYDNLYF